MIGWHPALPARCCGVTIGATALLVTPTLRSAALDPITLLAYRWLATRRQPPVTLHGVVFDIFVARSGGPRASHHDIFLFTFCSKQLIDPGASDR